MYRRFRYESPTNSIASSAVACSDCISVGVCCREEIVAGQCENGKNAAQENQDCHSEIGTPGGEEFKVGNSSKIGFISTTHATF